MYILHLQIITWAWIQNKQALLLYVSNKINQTF